MPDEPLTTTTPDPLDDPEFRAMQGLIDAWRAVPPEAHGRVRDWFLSWIASEMRRATRVVSRG